MRKISLEKAKETITKLVTEDVNFDEQSLKEFMEMNDKYPDVGEERSKAFDEHFNKWDHKNKNYKKLLDFTLIPIKKSKRCCANCGSLFCKINRVVPDNTRYCHSWHSKPVEEYTESAYNSFTKEMGLSDLPPELRIKIKVDEYLNFYKLCLEKSAEEENKIQGDTLPIPEKFVKLCEKEIKDNRKKREQYKKEREKCWEKDGTGELSWYSLNMEKAAQVDKKYNMCPMKDMMVALGLDSLSIKKVSSWEQLENME